MVGAAVAGTAFQMTGALLAKAAFSAGISMLAGSMSDSGRRESPSFTSEARSRTQMIRASTEPRRAIYGSAPVSGVLVFADSTGDSNKYLHLVVCMAGHQCQAINDIIFNDEVVGGYDVASGMFTTGRYAGKVRIRKHLGAVDQLPDADLNADSAKWAAKYRPLRGITYIAVRLEYDRDVFPTGIPNIRANVDGKNTIWDVRTGNYGWYNNAALCQLDYILWLYGMRCTVDEIDSASWIAAANISDEDVALPASAGGGTQKRYVCNGTFTLDRKPGDMLRELRSASAGALIYRMGKWYGYAGAADVATQTLNEDDLRGPVKIRTLRPKGELFNAVRGLFFNPDDHNQLTDFPPVTNAFYETQDGGGTVYKDVQYPFTDDVYAAQRLAKIELERHRQQITGTLPCKLKALRIVPWRPVKLNIGLLGFEDKLVRITNWRLTEDGGVDLDYEEYSAATWDWNFGMATTVDTAPNTTLPNPFDIDLPVGVTADSYPLTAVDGSVTHRLRVAWVTPGNPYVKRGEIQYRRDVADNWSSYPIEDPDQGEVVIGPLAIGAYQVRLRWESGVGNRTQWVLASGSAGAVPNAPAAAVGLLATGGMFRIDLDVTFGDARRDVWAEFWSSASNDRALANRVAIARWPESLAGYDGLSAGQTRYHWVRILDTSDNESAWYPLSATAGVSATVSSDPSALLTQLRSSLGMEQLAVELATPIAQVPDAMQAAQSAAEAALNTILKADELKRRAIVEEWVTNATTTTDPATGRVTLLATAEISTDVEAQLNSVQLQLGAMDGSITSHTETLNVQGDRITTNETDITQLQGDIVEKASTSYVDGQIAGALGSLDPAVVDAASQSGAEGLLQTLLDADASRRQAIMANARVASAERTLATQADAIVAEAVERLILAAQVAGNAAGLVSEASARATADSAIAALTTTLQARLDSGDYAAVKMLAEASADDILGLSAQHVLQVDVNGHVAGQKLAADETGSAVIWLADKFLMALPDGSGTPRQVLIIGMINGTPGLGFDGNLIVDGSIVARSLSVDQLSAITANLGIVTAGLARNAANTNIINLDAVGSQSFIKVGSNIDIKADGSAVFTGVVLSRQLQIATGNVPSFNGTYAITKAEGWKLLKTIVVDTGITVPGWWSASDTTHMATAGVPGGTINISAWSSDFGSFYANWGIEVHRMYAKTRWWSSPTICLELGLYAEVDGQVYQIQFTNSTVHSWAVYKIT